jgi:hypothetical protein
MDARFAVLRHLKALNYHDLSDAADWLDDQLLFHSSIKAFRKKETLRLMKAVFTAFPDWEISYDEPELQQGLVSIHLTMGGTHTGLLQLNLAGIKPLEATGRRVLLPKQKFTCRVADDRIVEIFPEPQPEGGLPGMLRQLGAQVPPTWWLKLMWTTSRVLGREVVSS